MYISDQTRVDDLDSDCLTLPVEKKGQDLDRHKFRQNYECWNLYLVVDSRLAVCLQADDLYWIHGYIAYARYNEWCDYVLGFVGSSTGDRLGVRDAIISGDRKKLAGDPEDGDISLGSLVVGFDQVSPKLGGGGG